MGTMEKEKREVGVGCGVGPHLISLHEFLIRRWQSCACFADVVRNILLGQKLSRFRWFIWIERLITGKEHEPIELFCLVCAYKLNTN